jgi:hypothetical protein
MPMNPEIKAKWVSALRSGEYTQLDGHLAMAGSNKMCCLGVLVDVAGKWDENFYDGYRMCDGNCSLPPDELCASVGLPPPARDGSYRATIVNRLADMNDQGKTFEEIADYIEKML